MRSIALRACVLVTAALLAVAPLRAVAESPDFPNDIPGAPLPASPVKGTLDETEDPDDVFSIQLQAGQWFYVETTGSSGLDLDLFLFSPQTLSVFQQVPAVAYSEKAGTSSERLRYQAPAAGTYYLNVWAYKGSGSYSLVHGFPAPPLSLTITAPSKVAWGRGAEVKGTATDAEGAPVAGERLYLYAKPEGAKSFSRIGQVSTDASGTYSFSPVPSRRTVYRVRHLGSPRYLPSNSAYVTITPYAYLPAPSAPSTIRPNTTFTVNGLLRPKHPVGGKDVTVIAYRYEADKWVVRKKVAATNSDYYSYTRYVAKMALPKGRWKLVSRIYGDEVHLTTTSKPLYRTVQ